MTTLVRDLRIIWDPYDAKTNLTFTTTNAKTDVVTADPAPIEATASIGMPVSASTEDIYADNTFSGTDADFSGTFGGLVYGWVITQGAMAASDAADPGVGLQIGDGTNRQAYGLAGNDKVGFRHENDLPDWQCLLLDTKNLPAATFTSVGNDTAPTLSTIGAIGHAFTTISAAKGGLINCYSDIIKYSDSDINNGIQVMADSATAISTFADITAIDRSGVDLGSAGILRTLGAGAYSCQGKITFGDSATGGNDLDFIETGITFLFEDRGLATVSGAALDQPRLGLKTSSGSSNTTEVTFGTRTGTGTGGDGCQFVVPAGVDANIDFSDSDVSTLGLYASGFRNFYDIKFATHVGASAHEVFQCNFTGCGQIDVGRTEFKNNTIAAGKDSAAVSFIDLTNVSGISFASVGSGHAISMDSATSGESFDFNNITFAGYAGTSGTTGNEALINNTGVPITVNIIGGDVPTVDSDGIRGKVSIVASVNVTLSGILGNSEILVLENPSPFSDDVASPVTVTTVETVAAVTGTDITYDSAAGDVITISSTSTDFTTIGLNSGDAIRVTDRSDLLVFDTFEVVGTPTTNSINVVDKPAVESQLGYAPTEETVTVEKIGSSSTFATTAGKALDILVFRIGSDPEYILNFSASTTTIPIQQSDDRNYDNP